MTSESIFNGKTTIFSLADVKMFDKFKREHDGQYGAEIHMNGFRYNEYGVPDNTFQLWNDEYDRFFEAWKAYRHEVGGVKDE